MYESKEADLLTLKDRYREIFEHAVENFDLPTNRRNLNGAGNYITYLMTVQHTMEYYQNTSCSLLY